MNLLREAFMKVGVGDELSAVVTPTRKNTAQVQQLRMPLKIPSAGARSSSKMNSEVAVATQVDNSQHSSPQAVLFLLV